MEKPKADMNSVEVSKDATSKNQSAQDGNHGEDCGTCSKKVTDSQSAIRCDICGFWYHTGYEGMSPSLYTFLSENDLEESIKWLCKKCNIMFKSTYGTVLRLEEQHKRLEEKVDALIERMEVSTSSQSAVGVEIKSLQKTVEEAIDKQKLDVNLDVGEIVSTKLKEDQEELEEIRKRRTSIIVHGLVESMADNVESRKEEDENRFVDLLHDIKCDDISVNCMYRLGWRHEDPSTNPRPLMVVVASETQKEKVLHQSKNLKFRNMNNRVKIYIHQDLTKKQRERRQLLVKEKKDERL